MIRSSHDAPAPERAPLVPAAQAGTDAGQGAASQPATIRQRLTAGLRRARDAERRVFGRGGWLRIVRNALVSFIMQAGTRMAAALSYYALLAAGPLLVLTIALGGLILGEHETRDIVALTLPRLLPVSAELPSQLVESVVRSSPPATGLALVTGIFSMIGFTRALTSSLNVTLNEIGGESIRRTARIVPLLYLAVLGLLWGSWAFEVVSRVADANVDQGVIAHPGVLLGTVAPLSLAIVHVGIILAIVPRAPLTLLEIVTPAIIGGTLWEAARNLFGWLVGTDSFYLQLFGPLGGAVALLGWIYLSSVILVLTGQIAWAYAMERRGRGHLARRLPRQAGLEERAQTPFEVENAVNEAQL